MRECCLSRYRSVHGCMCECLRRYPPLKAAPSLRYHVGIREVMSEKIDFKGVIALFVSKYKETSIIKQTKLPSLNISSKTTMKHWSLCYNKTTACLLTCPIDSYKSGTAAVFYGWLGIAPLFLLCKYIIWLSGLWFKCRSINLQVSAWCLQMILAQGRAKGALTLMTPAGCQFWAGQGRARILAGRIAW